jgi:AcrR family transcriptional regulator
MSEPIWVKPKPGGRQSAHSREQIAAAALAIADAEGLEAVSMRRVAGAVGLGTMSLYHYVPSKRDLLTLMGDAILGELALTDEDLRGNWRERVAQIARRTRAVWQRHPWAIAFLRDVRVGPNGMQNLERTLAALDDLPADPERRLELLSLIDSYVLGFVIRNDLHEKPKNRDEWISAVGSFMEQLLQDGDFPHASALYLDPDPATVIRRLSGSKSTDERFERGLSLLLDGIHAELIR